MPYKLDFTIPGLPDLQVAAGKGHWRARQAESKRWEDRVRAIVLGDHYLPDKPLKRARVLFERHSASEPDRTNLVASFKAIEDALTARPRGRHGQRVGVGVLEDDKPENYEGGAPAYGWVPAKRGEGFIRVRVEETELNPTSRMRWIRTPNGFGDKGA